MPPAKKATKAAKRAPAKRAASKVGAVINTANDYLELFADEHREHRWRRRDGNNDRIVAVSGEGYVEAGYARAAAEAYNPGVPIRE